MADEFKSNKRKSSESIVEHDIKRPKAGEPSEEDPVIPDPATGKPIRVKFDQVHGCAAAPIGNEHTPAVIAAVEQMLQEAGDGQPSVLSLARIGAAMYKRNLMFYDHKWYMFTKAGLQIDEFFGIWPVGPKYDDTLLTGIGRVLLALVDRFPRSRAMLTSTQARLDNDLKLAYRVALRMTELMKHDTLPPTPIAAESMAAVGGWLARVLERRRLVRCEAMSKPLSAEAYRAAAPALVSDLWADFAASHPDAVPGCTVAQFVRLLAGSLNEWPRHDDLFCEEHFLGYQWRTE
jgi:hypothetical protein